MRAMQRVSTTVVCVVGGDGSAIDSLRHKANIVVYQPDTSAPAMARALDAWELARRSHTAYFVHDADPLVPVADAWGGYFGGSSPVGELEVAVKETLARWRAGALELPDYYLVFSADEWSPHRRHWYLGLLAGTATSRVATVDREPDLAHKLAGLPAGPWWPELDRLLPGIERLPPDQAGLPKEANSATTELEKPRLVTARRVSGSRV
jgi:hypothetical protein